MTVALRNWKEWVVALDTVSLEILAERTDVTVEDYRLDAAPCPKHGGTCVVVIAGEILYHVRWPETEPTQLAGELLRLMLPAGAATVRAARAEAESGGGQRHPRPPATSIVRKSSIGKTH